MPPYQRLACRRALFAGAACGAILLVLVLANTQNITATTYRLTLSAVSQAPTRALAAAAGIAPARFIGAMLAKGELVPRRERSTRAALGSDGETTTSQLFVQSFTVESRNEKALSLLAARIERRSPWRVSDLRGGGEFVATKDRNVRLWRIRTAMLAPGRRTQTWLQISGPGASLGYADYLSFAFIAVLVVSFGSLERGGGDPSAFPPGLHPVVVCSQIVLASLLACWIWTYAHISGGEITAGFLAMCGLAAISLSVWAMRTKAHWKTLCC